jgi:hypothetical protein
MITSNKNKRHAKKEFLAMKFLCNLWMRRENSHKNKSMERGRKNNRMHSSIIKYN